MKKLRRLLAIKLIHLIQKIYPLYEAVADSLQMLSQMEQEQRLQQAILKKMEEDLKQVPPKERVTNVPN